MHTVITNTCTRCGTPRVVVKTWKEKMGDSTIYNTQTACPNKTCQQQVDADIQKQNEKHAILRQKREERIKGKRNKVT